VSGVFISAPRRTGKSTLINEDIIPFLKTAGAEVIYVDLWADRSRDPGDLISEAIREHLQKREGAILQWVRRGGKKMHCNKFKNSSNKFYLSDSHNQHLPDLVDNEIALSRNLST
jgi:hypothetical protein